MRLTLITIGSRGDVQPYIPLSLGLQRARHHVRFTTHSNFEDFVTGHGLDFAPLHGDPQAIMASQQGQTWMNDSANPLDFLRQMRDIAAGMVSDILADCEAACAGADAVIFSMLGFLGAFSVMEKHDLPGVGAYLQPVHPTAEFPMLNMPALPDWLPGQAAYNRLTHEIGLNMNSFMFSNAINAGRANVLDMPPMPSSFQHMMAQPHPVVYGFSPQVVPRPADWDEHVALSGFWFLDERADWQPPADLAAFLADGPPPVYIGFGSMAADDADTVADIALTALRQAGQRGLLLTGWDSLRPQGLPDDVFAIEAAPHDWLFPRMAAVVHHSGAGTTAAGLRAGVPTVTVPIFADQPFWAERVHALGVGPAPIPRQQLTVDRLAYAIRVAATHPGIRARAQALGTQIRAEDGVGNAVRFIEGALQ